MREGCERMHVCMPTPKPTEALEAERDLHSHIWPELQRESEFKDANITKHISKKRQ